jgi:integrase
VLGLRRGEIAGLRWEDLDRVGGTLKIRRQRQDYKKGIGITEDRPKTGATRTLYLTKGIIEEIDARGDLDSDYICTQQGHAWRPDALTRWFEWRKKDLGLPDEWTLHDLRHLAGMLLNAAGVQLTGIAAVLGHATTAMSERYVTHSAELRKADAERLSRMILG